MGGIALQELILYVLKMLILALNPIAASYLRNLQTAMSFIDSVSEKPGA